MLPLFKTVKFFYHHAAYTCHVHVCEIVDQAADGYDSRLYVWDVQQDSIQFFDFHTGKNDVETSSDSKTVPVKKLVHFNVINHMSLSLIVATFSFVLLLILLLLLVVVTQNSTVLLAHFSGVNPE